MGPYAKQTSERSVRVCLAVGPYHELNCGKFRATIFGGECITVDDSSGEERKCHVVDRRLNSSVCKLVGVSSWSRI